MTRRLGLPSSKIRIDLSSRSGGWKRLLSLPEIAQAMFLWLVGNGKQYISARASMG